MEDTLLSTHWFFKIQTCNIIYSHLNDLPDSNTEDNLKYTRKHNSNQDSQRPYFRSNIYLLQYIDKIYQEQLYLNIMPGTLTG